MCREAVALGLMEAWTQNGWVGEDLLDCIRWVKMLTMLG